MKKVGVLGSVGTFTHVALEKFEKELNLKFEPVFFSSVDLCFQNFSKLDYIVLPIENSIDGFIQRNLDLLLDYQAFVIKSTSLKVDFKFVSNTKDISSINKLYVFYKTLNQCSKFVNSFKDLQIEYSDHNIDSFERFRNDNSFLSSAIIPKHINTSRDQFIVEDIVDEIKNETRFFIVSKDKENHLIDNSIIKVLLVITPDIDSPGILVDILNIFKEKKINLSSLMSRPTRKELGKYHFFIELSYEYNKSSDFEDAINRLKGSNNCQVLGLF
ncbi:MAG: hypothetical protein LBV58_02195 [Acholeplasmatales bacterium]|jgi:prephenate dehydratase|nr:hypothetical protein [Acholeplasmatales bacterium]